MVMLVYQRVIPGTTWTCGFLDGGCISLDQIHPGPSKQMIFEAWRPLGFETKVPPVVPPFHWQVESQTLRCTLKKWIG